MKDVSDIVACVIDRGVFFPVAERLSREYKKVYYHRPNGEPFETVAQSCLGDGHDNVEYCDDFWSIKSKIDVFVFPDCQEGGTQVELESQGFPVWGSKHISKLERMRGQWIEKCKELGLPMPKTETIRGLTNLRLYLNQREGEKFFVKISRFRGDCFDEKTEIFTEHGWKHFSDLKPGEQVATMPIDGRGITYAVPDAYIKRWHDGNMVRIKSKFVDALVTENHCFWISTKGKEGWRYKKLSNIWQKHFSVPVAFQWSGQERTTYEVTNAYTDSRHQSRVRNIAKTLNMDDWLDFLGWFISEGSISVVNGKYRVTITQSKTANRSKYDELHECLKKLPFKIHVEQDRGFSIYDKSLLFELARTCYETDPCPCCESSYTSHNKQVPYYVKTLPANQISIFMNSYRKGDGCTDARSGQVRYYTSSKWLADDVQELVFKMGGSATISVFAKKGDVGGINKKGVQIVARKESFCIGASFRQDALVSSGDISKEHYCGYVYDVTVNPHHTIFVRRNGRAYWSGNCETWETKDKYQVQNKLDYLAMRFGPLQECVTFYVQEPVETEIESGSDTYNVWGQYPDEVIIGYELKGQSYYATTKKASEMPEEIWKCSEAIEGLLREGRYSNFVSSEVRISKDDSFWLDPCFRCPSPAGEEQLEMYENFGEIVWRGAQGELVQPVWAANFCGEAVIGYSGDRDAWKSVTIPEEIRQWVKLYACAFEDGAYHFPPSQDPEAIGCAVGLGDKPEDVLDRLKEIAEALKDQPVELHIEPMAKLFTEIEEAEKQGIEFSDEKLPEPAAVLE